MESLDGKTTDLNTLAEILKEVLEYHNRNHQALMPEVEKYDLAPFLPAKLERELAIATSKAVGVRMAIKAIGDNLPKSFRDDFLKASGYK